MSDLVVITGKQDTANVHLLTVRSALKLEIRTAEAGMPLRHSRGSVLKVTNKILGTNHRTKRAAYDALNDHIVSIMGPDFSRPLPAAR